jgi:hypothetical protein
MTSVGHYETEAESTAEFDTLVPGPCAGTVEIMLQPEVTQIVRS